MTRGGKCISSFPKAIDVDEAFLRWKGNVRFVYVAAQAVAKR